MLRKKVLNGIGETGFAVDFSRHEIRFPSHVMEEWKEKVSKDQIKYDRDGRFDITMKLATVTTRAVSGCPKMVDPDTGICRRGCKKGCV